MRFAVEPGVVLAASGSEQVDETSVVLVPVAQASSWQAFVPVAFEHTHPGA